MTPRPPKALLARCPWLRGFLPTLAIVLLCVGAAAAYGLIHNQITARVCIEYFTIGHPRMFKSDSPTLHALFWGVAATWWAGLLSGLLIATAARAGSWPRLTVRNVWPLVLALVVVMALAAWTAGTFGRSFAKTYPPEQPLKAWGGEVPANRYADFMACAYAHGASYQVGFVGSAVVAGVVVARRWKWAKRRSAAANIGQASM